MTRRLLISLVLVAVGVAALTSQESRPAVSDVRLMTLDPGHFHAALIQKEMYPGVAARVDIYAPAGTDLDEHLKRVNAFNQRAASPTSWQTELHTGPDFLARMLRERPGNVVVISGRNRPKMDRVRASVGAGLHVLADKPWILTAAELPGLEAVLAEADEKGLAAYDIMTERFEITTILQRALVNDPATFGEIIRGSEAEPGVYMESVHYLMKVVSGAPNIRPPWFFDTTEQGEGLNDIGHSPGGPRAVDTLSRPGGGLSNRHPGAFGTALADVDSRGRLPARDRTAPVREELDARREGWTARVPTPTPSFRTPSAACTRS